MDSLPSIYALICPNCKVNIELIHSIGTKLICPVCEIGFIISENEEKKYLKQITQPNEKVA